MARLIPAIPPSWLWRTANWLWPSDNPQKVYIFAISPDGHWPPGIFTIRLKITVFKESFRWLHFWETTGYFLIGDPWTREHPWTPPWTPVFKMAWTPPEHPSGEHRTDGWSRKLGSPIKSRVLRVWTPFIRFL